MMGLDLVIYTQDNKKQICEISEALHKAIFSSTNPAKASLLNRMKDYYKTNLFLTAAEANELVSELSSARPLIDSKHYAEIDLLIEKLRNPTLNKIHIAGD